MLKLICKNIALYNKWQGVFVKKFMSIAIVTTLILHCMISPLSAHISTAFFNIYLNGKQDIDLSGVKADIYYQVDVVQYTEQLTIFDKKYICSVTSNRDGMLSFPKPGASFIVEFDLSTLPAGTGVKKQTLIYDVDSNSDAVTVYPVASVQPSLSSDELNFVFKGENDDNILVNYELVSHKVEELAQKATLDSSAISCTLKHYGDVDVNGAVYSYHVNKNYSDLNELEYANLLFNEGAITYDKRIDMICDDLSFETMYMLEGVQRETNNLELKQKISNTLATTSSGYIDDPATFKYIARTFYCHNEMNCCEGGIHEIRVYYSNSICSTAKASALADELINVFEFYCTELHFRCPKSITHTNSIPDTGRSFCVILSIDAGLGKAPWEGEARHIVANPNAYEISDGHFTTFSHEFMHCIQREYNLTGFSKDTWINEACANLGTMMYCEYNGVLSAKIKEVKAGIKEYLQSTKTSIITGSGYRHYSILLPLFLYQAFDGSETIRQMYEQIYYQRPRTDENFINHTQIFAAISNVVSAKGDSLRAVLEDFGRKNYNYADFYNWLRGTNWTEVQLNKDYLIHSSANKSTIENIGYGYYELTSSPRTVTITINAQCSDPTEITCWVIEGFGDTKVAKETKIRLTGSTLNMNYTFVSSLGNNLCLIVENTSITNSSDITITVN